VGWSDSVDIPFARIKQHKPAANKDLSIPPGFSSFVSRGAAVAKPTSPRTPTSPPMNSLSPPLSPPRKSVLRQVLTPQSSPTRNFTLRPTTRNFTLRKTVPNRTNKSSNLIHLEQLKQDAVLSEDFLLANQLKLKIEKLNDLEIKKADAVRKEDFLAAMDIKKQISQLLNDNSSSESMPAEQETKQQEFDDRRKKTYATYDKFSLFTKPVDCKLVY